jgi:hypothetical protein
MYGIEKDIQVMEEEYEIGRGEEEVRMMVVSEGPY